MFQACCLFTGAFCFNSFWIFRFSLALLLSLERRTQAQQQRTVAPKMKSRCMEHVQQCKQRAQALCSRQTFPLECEKEQKKSQFTSDTITVIFINIVDAQMMLGMRIQLHSEQRISETVQMGKYFLSKHR